MSETKLEPTIFVIFGGTGDLSRRKLLPALGRLSAAGDLSAPCYVLGVGRSTDYDDAAFRKLAEDAMNEADVPSETVKQLCGGLHYQALGESRPEDYQKLKERIVSLEEQYDLPGNRIFYLALPQNAFPGTIQALGDTGLEESKGWTRIVVEKPFGHDLESARQLNALVHRYFDERQIYRIDHYLGKDTVQNLLVFRFGNAILESLWNREKIEAVEIVVAEDLGVGSRAGYYDKAGALKDMVQNHLTQLLTLVAMEVPVAYEADAVRYEKIKVLRSLAPIRPDDVVFGQYAAGRVDGEDVPGYLDESGVASDSSTETFVAMRLEIDSWRWQGVPFYLRTGKRLPKRLTQIVVRFRHPPICLFESMGGCLITENLLKITVQPNEGFSLHLDVKEPGAQLALRQIPLKFQYSEEFDEIPEAYQTLLLDLLEGDQTLFVHADEVEAAWSVYKPLQEQPPPIRNYRAGTWGPPEADWLATLFRED